MRNSPGTGLCGTCDDGISASFFMQISGGGGIVKWDTFSTQNLGSSERFPLCLGIFILLSVKIQLSTVGSVSRQFCFWLMVMYFTSNCGVLAREIPCSLQIGVPCAMMSLPITRGWTFVTNPQHKL